MIEIDWVNAMATLASAAMGGWIAARVAQRQSEAAIRAEQEKVRKEVARDLIESRKINDIVRRSTEDIDLGAAMAEETGRVIAAADVHVGAIHKAIVDVAHLTREGGTESAAILGEIKALTEVTDRNTALVEQLALASRSLHTQGATLTDKVNRFRLG